ncbi:hypothetical protein Tco_0255615, partial [Tanacetum coccineum]
GASVTEPGPFSDPNIASSSRPHEFAPDQFTSTNVEDETMGGSFQTSPPRSTQAPPEGTTSGGAEDLDKLTALSSLVSTLVQRVNTQESELNAHKLLFKEVVGKLVKKVKLLEDKLKGRKIKLAKAAATAAADSAIPTGGSHEADIPPSSSVPTDEFADGSDVPAGATTGPSADPFNKGKSPLMEEDPPVKERSFRQREEDRLGEEAARRMYEEEKAELEREREEMQRKRQQDVLNSAKYYTDSDWNDIMGQVHANQGLTADLLGPDVTEDNFAERMVALIAKRRREFAAQRFQDKLNKPMTFAQQKAYMRTFVKNQSSTIYTTGWTMKHVKSFSDDQLKTEFDKIRTAAADLQSQNIRRSLKRPGADLEQASSKKSKSTEAPKSDVPADSQQPSVEVPSQKATIEDVEVPSTTASTAQHTGSSPKKVGTRKKRLGRKGVHPSHSTIPIEDGDPEAEHKMCIKYASDADSASDDDTPVNFFAVVEEVIPTGLGVVNALYFMDKSSKAYLPAGSGMILWGIYKSCFGILMNVDGCWCWVDQQQWLSGVELQLDRKDVNHKLEVEIDGSWGMILLMLSTDFSHRESGMLLAIRLESIEDGLQSTMGVTLSGLPKLWFSLAISWKKIGKSQEGTTLMVKTTSTPLMAGDGLPKNIRDLNSAISTIRSGSCTDFIKFMKVAFGVGFKMIAFPSSVARWWESEIQDFQSYVDWLSWFNALRLSKGLKDVLEGVFYSVLAACMSTWGEKRGKRRRSSGMINLRESCVPMARVMSISVISVSSDSSEDSVGTPVGRVILIGTIPTTIPDTTPSVIPPTTHIDTTPIPTISPTIPSSPDYTPASPDYSPAFDTEFDPSEDSSSDHIPPLPATSPFLLSTYDSLDSDIPDTPPSPTHGTPFTETTLSTQRSPTTFGALRRRVMVLAPRQPIPHGRPYHYHLNGPVHMMTMRKRVGPLPTHHLAMRHSVDYSSSDHFSSDDSWRDSSSSSSSKSSSDSSADALSDSESSRSSSDHSLPASPSGTRFSHHLCSLVPSFHRSSAISERPSHDSSFASLSRKRSKSPVASIPLSSPTLGAFSYARDDLLPSPKRIRRPETATDLEGCSKDSFEPYVPREAEWGVDFEDESSESSRSRGTNLEMDVDVERSDGIEIYLEVQTEIDECFAYADALIDRGIDDRVEGAIEVIKSVQRDQGHRIVATRQQSADMLERIGELDRDNRRLRDIVDVESLRLVPGGIWVIVLRLFHDYPSIDSTMSNTQSRASRTREGVNEQSNHWMAEALRVRDVVRNLGPLMGDEGEQEVNGNRGNRGNGNGGNGNGNRNGNGNGGEYGYNFRGFMPARECTYQDFLKCQPLNFNETKGVVGLTRWFEKMETVFHISNCPEKYQVKLQRACF